MAFKATDLNNHLHSGSTRVPTPLVGQTWLPPSTTPVVKRTSTTTTVPYTYSGRQPFPPMIMSAGAAPHKLPKTSSTRHHHHHPCSHKHTQAVVRPRQRRRATYVEPSIWESIFCAEGASRQGISLCAARRRRRREPKPRMFDDEFGRISVDSNSDWDEFEANERVWGQRQGPKKERVADDLMITFRDLLPCCTPIFDKCGCCGDTRPRKRALIRAKELPESGAPRVETVCLECGNVLMQNALPRTIAADMYDRGTPERALALEQLAASMEEAGREKEVYEGYREWEVQAGALADGRRKRVGRAVPLPNFNQAPARMFKNRPSGSGRHPQPRGDGYDVDETGHISLPAFEVPAK